MSETQDEQVQTKGTEVETVQMQDGRSVDFAGKRKMLKESIINHEGIFVRLDFRNGETRTFRLPDYLIAQFAAHGAEQKLGDETAGTKDVDDMTLEIDELIERLNKGEWSTRRESSGLAGTSVLLRALVEVYGRTPEQVKAFLKDKSQAEKTALRNHQKIRPVVDRIEAEKASKAAKVDTDALLATI